MTLAAVLLAAAPPAPAAEDAGGLGLEEALFVTLERSIGIRLARQQSEVSLGDLRRARGLFDGVLSATGSGARTEDPLLGPLAFETSDLALAWSQTLRSGPTVTPSVFVARTDVSGGTDDATNSGGVDLTVRVPLLRDRGGVVGRSTEQAAEAVHEGDLESLIHAHSTDIVATTAAYWRYLAAQQRLEVFRQSEERAVRLVDETRILVDARERPAADLNQVEANAAGKRIETLAAAQLLAQFQRALGLAMGLPAEEVARIPAATDGFPTTEPEPVAPERVAEWVAVARERRSDLEAVESDARAAALTLDAAESQLRSRLDLSLTVGYRGLALGSEAGAFFDALHLQVPGVSAAVALSYELPHENLAARGRATRSSALLAKQRILVEDLDRRIVTAVQVAASDLVSAIAQDAYIEAAVSLSRATVSNEREKYALGLATLFDVILAEDGLTDALLSEIDVRLAYALALADLHFETGSLVTAADSSAEALARRLTKVPEP